MARCTHHKLLVALLGLTVLSLTSCSSQIRSIKLHGQTVAQIDDLPAMYPTWSPNGDKIAFIELPTDGEPNGAGYIAIMDVATRRVTRLSGESGAWSWPKWSPDGTTLVVSRHYEVWRVNTASGETSLLAQGEAATWSPDGTVVAVFQGPKSGGPDDHFQIALVTPEGKRLRWLPAGTIDQQSGTSLPPIIGHGYFAGIAWSPDGRSIAYSFVYPNNRRGDIFTLSSDGTELHPVTFGGINEEPAWSPDGTWIAYVSSDDLVKYDLYITTADGSCQVRLSENGYVHYPSWSPNGVQLSFVSSSAFYILDVRTVLEGDGLKSATCEGQR